MKKETNTIVKLSQPIKRGEKEFSEITVIKPTIPALRGLKMLDVLHSDVNALTVLLPRVTQPMLHKNDFDSMEVSDFVDLAGAALSFLAPTSDSEETASF